MLNFPFYWTYVKEKKDKKGIAAQSPIQVSIKTPDSKEEINVTEMSIDESMSCLSIAE